MERDNKDETMVSDSPKTSARKAYEKINSNTSSIVVSERIINVPIKKTVTKRRKATFVFPLLIQSKATETTIHEQRLVIRKVSVDHPIVEEKTNFDNTSNIKESKSSKCTMQ